MTKVKENILKEEVTTQGTSATNKTEAELLKS